MIIVTSERAPAMALEPPIPSWPCRVSEPITRMFIGGSRLCPVCAAEAVTDGVGRPSSALALLSLVVLLARCRYTSTPPTTATLSSRAKHRPMATAARRHLVRGRGEEGVLVTVPDLQGQGAGSVGHGVVEVSRPQDLSCGRSGHGCAGLRPRRSLQQDARNSLRVPVGGGEFSPGQRRFRFRSGCGGATPARPPACTPACTPGRTPGRCRLTRGRRRWCAPRPRGP